MKKTIRQSRAFTLTQENVRNPNKVGKGKRYYTIQYHGWDDADEVRAAIDPKYSIGGKNAYKWKFKDRAVAEKKWTLLMLRWA